MVVNRRLPVPSFTQTSENGFLTITDEASDPQVPGSTSRSRSGRCQRRWHQVKPGRMGMLTYGNLFGTIRSLDELCTITLNCTENANTYVHNENLYCAWGVVSRAGRTVVDEHRQLHPIGHRRRSGSTNKALGRTMTRTCTSSGTARTTAKRCTTTRAIAGYIPNAAEADAGRVVSRGGTTTMPTLWQSLFTSWRSSTCRWT